MVATTQQIIGKVNPYLYAENGKDLLKKYKSVEAIPPEEVKPKPLQQHLLVYDSSSETLEPIYFFILDLMGDFGLKVEKLADSFTSSPGSGHFAELGQRATIMQQQGSKILGDINTVLRSTLNLIYDLKEFKIRLEHYKTLKSKDENKKQAALLSLKQIWMDKVDITKGNSSLKAMGLGQAGFTTLIDAFLAAKDEKDVEKLDLNERVKRILLPRINEFHLWLKESERELRKRYDLERNYLKSQVNSLKLYSRWAKPYLKAAAQLEMFDSGRNPALIKTFNTILLELTLLGKSVIPIPPEYSKFPKKRDYYRCVIIDFSFRGIPQRSGQQPHYLFGGKTEVTFSAYALNEDELKLMDKEIDKSDVGDVLRLIEGTTEESLNQLQEDINEFLDEKSEEESKEEKDVNPFLALIGRYEKKETKSKSTSSKKKKELTFKKDNWIEAEHYRKIAMKEAKQSTFDLFNVYKKAHGMANFDWIIE